MAEVKFDVPSPDTVSVPAELESPEPKSLLNDDPLTMRLVVEAVMNDEYMVDEEYGEEMRLAAVTLPKLSMVVEAVPPIFR